MIDAVVGFTVDGKPDVGKTVNGIAVIGKANAKKYELSNHERIKYYPDNVSSPQLERRWFAPLLS